MLETFLHNNMEQKQKVNEHALRKYENTENGCDLWLASKCRWPLQELVYNAVAATPKKLCCLEKILLYIYQLMPDEPPDSKTITTKLCLGETSFIDKIISDLVNLGALEVNSTGRLVVTPLGHQCCSRGSLHLEVSLKKCRKVKTTEYYRLDNGRSTSGELYASGWQNGAILGGG